jgi:pimeloyl-ACP methyl ester carboxylesterase
MSEISAARYRAGDGPTLVLVHGFTATWRCWLPVLAELVPHFDVLAPTLHGHDGGPQPPKAAKSLGDAADHFEALLDEQGVGEAHFAGNSMGGSLSLELAKRGRAKSVVAISPGGGWTDEREVKRIENFFLRTRKLSAKTAKHTPKIMARPGLRRLALRDVLVHGDQMPPKEAVMLAESSLRCTVVDEVLATVRSGAGRITELDKVACPTLVTWGEKDRILPLKHHAARFREEIPGVEFRAIPKMGHTPMYDDPGLIASTIRDFALAAERSRSAVAA